MGTLDTKTRQYTTDDGAVFTLQPVPPLTIERIQSDTWGKPQPPVVEVQIGKSGKRKEANPNDPDYIAALAEWETARSKRLMFYIFIAGIEEEPDEDEITNWHLIMPGAVPMTVKYLWITQHLRTQKEIEDLSQAIISQTLPTQEGLEEAAARFPGEG